MAGGHRNLATLRGKGRQKSRRLLAAGMRPELGDTYIFPTAKEEPVITLPHKFRSLSLCDYCAPRNAGKVFSAC